MGTLLAGPLGEAVLHVLAAVGAVNAEAASLAKRGAMLLEEAATYEGEDETLEENLEAAEAEAAGSMGSARGDEGAQSVPLTSTLRAALGLRYLCIKALTR